MTKEEAIEDLLRHYTGESTDMAIKALKREPCEDAVSRKELKKWLDMNFSFGGASRKIELFDRLDKELPPVTPTRKKGKWIRVGSGSLIDDFRCDCCNKQPPIKKVGYTWGWDFTRYCPNCGEPKEGEE